MTKKIKVLFTTLGVLGLSACTKSIPYKELPPGQKEHVISKALIDEKAEYLYSASMQNASRSSADALPFSTGDNKRVKLQITEKFLNVLETERDARFAANKANDKIILQVPIEHVEFQCAKDRYGECKNEEENSEQTPWAQRSGLRVKLDEAKSGELDLLPIMISQTLGENCYQALSSKLTSSEIDGTSINFQVERNFLTNIACLGNVDTLTDANVKANFHYSLVKLDSVLTKGFEPIVYQEGSPDEGAFGFFSSKRVILDVDNNKTVKSSQQVLNHWNPNREEIVYHLSDEFSKPENKQLRDLTFQTIGNLNQGLKEAGIKFRINLKDASGKVPGDIRNSMIVLVEDPVASSIIGYGPQTEDPVTGEIISARTIMFLGTIKKFIQNKYEQIRQTSNEVSVSGKPGTPSASRLSVGTELSQKMALAVKSGRAFNGTELTRQMKKGLNQKINLSVSKESSSQGKIDQMKAMISNYTANINPELSGKDLKSQLRYQHYHKNCALEPTAEAFSDSISSKLTSQFGKDSKPWEQLSEDEKANVVEVLLPEVWIATLIHEVGHNLGLRHNFAASEDKENFLSPEELKEKNIDHAIPFSSVMDYGDDLKALPFLGNYDKAALRFAYLRKVELKNGQTIEVQGSLDQMNLPTGTEGTALKDFKYCTDEHVGINAGCKRHDLGTSYTEIVQNYIKEYESNYARRNFRNGKANMSLMDDLVYAGRIHSIFNEFRLMLEVRERIKYTFKVADEDKAWETEPFLKDLNEAAILGGQFLAKVLTTPDVTCAIALKAKPNEIIQAELLENIDPNNAMSCFELKLLDQFVVVGQTGKFFNSKKDSKSRNNFADQIDVRGIWIDKVVAANVLFSRSTGIFNLDKNRDNFMNIPVLRSPLLQTLQGLMKNNVIDTVTLTLADGSKADLEMRYDQFSSQNINQPLFASIAQRLGVHTDRSTQLQEVLAMKFASGMNDTSGAHPGDQALAHAFLVKRADESQPVVASAKQFLHLDTRFIANSVHTLASSVIDEIAVAQVLEKVTPEKLAEIVKAKTAGQTVPTTATDDEKAVWSAPKEVIELFQNDLIKSSAYSTNLLYLLPVTK